MRAFEGSEQSDGEELTPRKRRKLIVESAGKRASLAETDAWTELLHMYVRDQLSFEVDARGDVTHAHLVAEHSTEGGHDACLRQDGLLQHSGSFADPAEQCVRAAERTNRC